MITASIGAMTVIDVAVIAAGGYIAVQLYRNRSLFVRFDAARYLLFIGLGGLVLAVFYAANLYIAWILPSIAGMSAAVYAMEELLHNYTWYVITIGFGAIAIAFTPCLRAIVNLVSRLEEGEKQLADRMVKLNASEEILSRLLAESKLGIHVASSEGKPIYVNDKFVDMFGYSSMEEVLALLVDGALTAPHDRQTVLVRRQARARGEEVDEIYEFDGLRKDGSVFPVQAFVQPTSWEGEPAVLRTLIDITDRRNAEESLRESEARFQAFFDHSPFVMYIKDRDDKLIVVNERYFEFLNVRKSDVVGKVRKSRLDPETKKITRSLDAHVLSSGQSVEKEVAMRGASGELRHFVITKFPIVGADGAIEAIGGINTDITELHIRQQELVASKLELEELAKMAEAANSAKSQFLATMSHEIRTPMNGVLGMADILAQTELTDQQRDFVETIRVSGKTLLDLLNDILDISKIEAGKVAVDKEDFNLATVLEATAALWKPAAESKGVRFSLQNTVDENCGLRGDRTRLRQVLNNLIGNAIKFTHEGRVDVAVTARPLGDEAIELRVDVKDTGVGIPADRQAAIFEPFTQADSSTTRHFGGTGLGLTISKSLVELMGGEIGFESTPGEGTGFWFSLPIELGDARAATADVRPVGREAEHPRTAGQRLHILVAEDNELNRQVMEWLLAPLKAQIDLVGNGIEAVAAVMRTNYDLILVDVQMPEKDGLEATKEIRSLDGATGNVPIIAVTANAMKGDKERYLEAGMDDYISKPIDQQKLFSVVEKHTGFPATGVDCTRLAGASSADTVDGPLGQEAVEDLQELDAELDKLLNNQM